MSVSGEAALAAARRLLRTFASAPDPRRQARMIYSELASGEGWTKAEQKVVDDLGAWLRGLPPIGDLKPRCAEVLTKLGSPEAPTPSGATASSADKGVTPSRDRGR